MNWQPFVQYLCLIGINCVEIASVNQLTVPSIVLPTATWILYLEFAVGSVLFRPDSKGDLNLVLGGVQHQLLWPLVDRHAWRPEFWDLNYYMVAGGTALAYSSLYAAQCVKSTFS